MRVALAVCPCYYHNLGAGYLNAVLRKNNHKVIPFDFEFILEAKDPKLLSRFIPLTFVYEKKSRDKVHFFLRPEVIFSALFGTNADMRKNAISSEEIEVVNAIKKVIPVFSRMILQNKPETILFPTVVMNMFFSLLLTQELKKEAKDIPIIFGGIGVSTKQVRDVILRLKIVDYCVVGEGEETIISLLKKMETGKGVNHTPGAACLVKNRLSYQSRLGVSDLDSLPYPDFEDFPFPGASIKQYARSKQFSFKQFIPIAASRYCANRCIFCHDSINQRNYRIRKVESVIDEMVSQSKKYGIRSFYLCDSTFNINLAWLEEFCDLIIQKNMKVHFKFVHLSPARLSLKLLNKMRKAGFEKINYGVESFSEKVLGSICKHNDIRQARAVLIDTACSKIRSNSGLIYNLPGQNNEDIYKTLDEILKIDKQLYQHKIENTYFTRYSFTPLRIDPHSAIFKNSKKYGIRLIPYKLHLPLKAKGVEGFLNKTLFTWKSGVNLESESRAAQKFIKIIRNRFAKNNE